MQNAAFFQDLHCFAYVKHSFGTDMHIFFFFGGGGGGGWGGSS